MFFFSFKVDGEEVRKHIADLPGEIVIFGDTGEKAPDGTPMCVVIGSAMDTQSVYAVIAVVRRLCGEYVNFFAYTKDQVIEGLTLSDLETKAGDN